MRKLLLSLVLFSSALAGSAFAQTGGRDVYVAKCSTCHAPDGSGNSTVGRSLKLSDVRPAILSMTDEQLRQLILEGKGKMPANKKFNEEQLRSLTLFLCDLAAGNPDTGQAVKQAQAQPLFNVKVVFRDKCSACHGSDGAGHTSIGNSLQIPDLTSASVQSQSSQELTKIISQGRGRMLPYAKKFNPVQVDQLVLYVRTLARSVDAQAPAPAKDEESQTSAQQPSSNPAQSAPQPAAISASASPPVTTAPANPPKVVGKGKAESKAASAPGVKKAPLTGRQIYIAKCSACHSSDGSSSGAIGKSMKISSLISPEAQVQSDESLTEVISNGVGKMPEYKKKFTPAQIQLLVVYIRELGKKQ